MLWLEFYRRQRRLTQGQVGERTGYSQVRISELERGLRPTERQLLTLAGFFAIPQANAGLLTREVPPSIAEVPPPPDQAAMLRAAREAGR